MSHLGDKEKETKQKTKNHERKKKKSNCRQNCEGNTALTMERVNHIGVGAATWQDFPATAYFYRHCK